MGTLAESPSPIPVLEPAEPRTEAPSGTTSICLLTSAFLSPGEAFTKEVLVKDPEVERRIEGFQGRVAVDCHLITPGLSLT